MRTSNMAINHMPVTASNNRDAGKQWKMTLVNYSQTAELIHEHLNDCKVGQLKAKRLLCSSFNYTTELFSQWRYTKEKFMRMPHALDDYNDIKLYTSGGKVYLTNGRPQCRNAIQWDEKGMSRMAIKYSVHFASWFNFYLPRRTNF